MNSSHFVEVDQLTPLGSAVTELASCRGVGFHEAASRLQEAFEQDCNCPVSGLFTERDVRWFYAERGMAINAVPMPRR